MLSGDFLFHVGIMGCIFYLLATGMHMFVRVRGYIDFSYMGVVILGSYITALTHIQTGWGIILSFLVAMGVGCTCMVGVSYIVSRLSGIYASIGTLSIYVLMYQLSYIFIEITGGAYGLSGLTKYIGRGIYLQTLPVFFIYMCICVSCVIVYLMYSKNTYVDVILRAGKYNSGVIESIGIHMRSYTCMLLCAASVIGILGGTNYAFYYAYLHPQSFRLPMVLLIIVIAFAGYGKHEITKLCIALGVVGVYEGLRFISFVDVVDIGYIREILFSFIIIAISVRIARSSLLYRDNI